MSGALSEQLREFAFSDKWFIRRNDRTPDAEGVIEVLQMIRDAADEIERLRAIVRDVPGYCVVCTKAIEDYQHKYDLHGPLADFCSQECFDIGDERAVPSGP